MNTFGKNKKILEDWKKRRLHILQMGGQKAVAKRHEEGLSAFIEKRKPKFKGL